MIVPARSTRFLFFRCFDTTLQETDPYPPRVVEYIISVIYQQVPGVLPRSRKTPTLPPGSTFRLGPKGELGPSRFELVRFRPAG